MEFTQEELYVIIQALKNTSDNYSQSLSKKIQFDSAGHCIFCQTSNYNSSKNLTLKEKLEEYISDGNVNGVSLTQNTLADTVKFAFKCDMSDGRSITLDKTEFDVWNEKQGYDKFDVSDDDFKDIFKKLILTIDKETYPYDPLFVLNDKNLISEHEIERYESIKE